MQSPASLPTAGLQRFTGISLGLTSAAVYIGDAHSQGEAQKA